MANTILMDTEGVANFRRQVSNMSQETKSIIGDLNYLLFNFNQISLSMNILKQHMAQAISEGKKIIDYLNKMASDIERARQAFIKADNDTNSISSVVLKKDDNITIKNELLSKSGILPPYLAYMANTEIPRCIQPEYKHGGTFGVGGSFMAEGGARFAFGFQFVFDTHGNIGICLSPAVGGGTAGVGASICGTYTNADTIYDLTGQGIDGGASANIPLTPISGGLDYVGSRSNGGVSGVTGSFGAKIDPFFEGHTDVSNTWMPFHINLMGEK